MTRSRVYTVFMLFGLMVCISGPLPAQFVTLARKIKSSLSGDGKDMATVILDAGAFNVYRAVMDTLANQPKCRITKKDPAKKLVEFTTGSNSVTMQVDSLGTVLSQITVTAASTGNSSGKASDIAVKAIFSVCKKVGIQCTAKEP